MKGLANTSPAFAFVNISGRSARKHYGISSRKRFDVTKHELSKRYTRTTIFAWALYTVETNIPLRVGCGQTFTSIGVFIPWTGL